MKRTDICNYSAHVAVQNRDVIEKNHYVRYTYSGKSHHMSEQARTKDDIIRLLNPVFRKNNSKKAVLFGSYARGEQTPQSDIDILVDSGLHGLAFFGLLEDVCNAIGDNVDLIDVYQVKKGSSIEREINDTGVTIYEQSR